MNTCIMPKDIDLQCPNLDCKSKNIMTFWNKHHQKYEAKCRQCWHKGTVAEFNQAAVENYSYEREFDKDRYYERKQSLTLK